MRSEPPVSIAPGPFMCGPPGFVTVFPSSSETVDTMSTPLRIKSCDACALIGARMRGSAFGSSGVSAEFPAGTKPVLTGVLFPRPDQFDRAFDDLCDCDGLYDFVAGIAAAKPSAEIGVMDEDLLRFQT